MIKNTGCFISHLFERAYIEDTVGNRHEIVPCLHTRTFLELSVEQDPKILARQHFDPIRNPKTAKKTDSNFDFIEHVNPHSKRI